MGLLPGTLRYLHEQQEADEIIVNGGKKSLGRITEQEACEFATALHNQLKRRLPRLEREVALALRENPKVEDPETLPPWGVAVIRQLFSPRGMFALAGMIGPDEKSWNAEKWGMVKGAVASWAALLQDSTPETAKLGDRFPVLNNIRREVGEGIKPAVARVNAAADAAQHKMEPMTAKNLADHFRGLQEGSEKAVTPEGEFREPDTATQVAYLFLWLYLPEIPQLESITQLHQFFADIGHDQISRKLLEKICAEIGLKLRKRGRRTKKFLPGLNTE